MSERASAGAATWLAPTTVVLLLLALAFFALLKTFSFRFVSGDEHVYNYMSLMVLEGQWPYRDFFSPHPPLPTYLTAFLFGVTGFSIAASKCVPIAAAMSSGIHLYLIGRRTLGPLEGLLAAILFLFTFDVIRGSSHPTSVNVAVAFILAGTYQVLRRRPVGGGVLLACASLTGVYAIPMMLMLATLLCLRSLRQASRFALGWGALMVLAIALFAAVTGGAFWENTVEYHLSKVPMGHSWYDKFENVFFLNFHVMAGFAPAIAWIFCRRAAGAGGPSAAEIEPRLPRWVKPIVARFDPWGTGKLSAAFLFTTFALGYLFFCSNLRVYYSYYFMLVLPWMALLTAFVVVDVPRVIWSHLQSTGNAGGRSQPAAGGDASPSGEAQGRSLSRQERRRRAREAEKHQRKTGGAKNAAPRAPWHWPTIPTAVALLLTFGYRERIGDQRVAEASSPVRNYRFVQSPFLGDGLNDWLERTLWSGVRDRRDPPLGIKRYLQHETVFSPTIDRFDEAVRSACHAGDRIFGDYSLAPYGAAISDCVVAANIIDTNGSRITSGESTMAGWIDAVETDGLDVVVWRNRARMSSDHEFRRYVLDNFTEVVFEWKDPHMGTVELRRRPR
jgi:hypothetical protein